MKLLFNILERKFISYLLKKNGAGFTKENLAFSFFDLEGNSYYSFPKEVALPVVRLGKLQEYYTWLSAGVTGNELSEMVEAADKALSNGLKDGKGVAKIGFILSELKDRKNMVIHHELYYNILAAQLIRHDEKINEWNNEIQLQKVEAFKLLDRDNDSFFLATRELLLQLSSSSITREKLLELLNESILRIKSMKEMLQMA